MESNIERGRLASPLSRVNPFFDVFIVGAGPAGSAVAISLSQVAPHLRVGLAEAGRNIPLRIGESIPPPIKPILDHLGVNPAFLQAGHCPAFNTLSAWGGSELIGNEFFLHAHNTGWRLDRARFDRMLAGEATRCGAQMLYAKVDSLSPDEQGWRLNCGMAGTFTARFVVDASGRRAILSRLFKLTPVILDRLVACVVFFAQDTPPEMPEADAAVVESFRDGWWYTAAIPDGRRIAMLMSDTDIARRLGATQLSSWLKHLAETRHVWPRLAKCRPLTAPKLWPATSRYFDPVFPPGLLAVGEAISSFDPLSSQGIIKALRSAIFASYAIADSSLRGDETGIPKYCALMRREFAAYQETWHDYYRQEQRWPAAPFWHRRH